MKFFPSSPDEEKNELSFFTSEAENIFFILLKRR